MQLETQKIYETTHNIINLSDQLTKKRLNLKPKTEYFIKEIQPEKIRLVILNGKHSGKHCLLNLFPLKYCSQKINITNHYHIN